MFEKVLIANRGEIALRVIRACKELGIKTLAVYSEADIDSLHVQLADEAICIGPPPSALSYLKIDQEALKVAKKIGYPVMIKSVAGGGGKGMRAAHNDVSLVQGFHGARMEAEKAFGNAGVYIEKLIENPHHIEFQVMADSHGEVVHLGERDCSMQRRNQKIIEETPSPIMTDEIRKKMGDDCVRLAKEVGYVGAGTIECLMDDREHYYFM